MKTAIIVPARVASTRFPQKLLHEIHGKPVLLWTAERIRAEAPEYPLFFAVDNDSLRTILADAGYDAIMTDVAHACGTDRIAEANRTIGAEYVVNVQADEPTVTGDQIRQLATLIETDVAMATLGSPLLHDRDYHNPNHVKLIRDQHGRAIYFSRSPIPYFREAQGVFDPALAPENTVLIHLGLYAYTRDFLEAFASMKPGVLENLEKLEMLRVLEHGERIAVGVSSDALIEIDTPEQAAEFEQSVRDGYH
ncbi:MAG: 3-deoxy-manno-octulosonate cytidylyltransferase [Planctomycetota bacterium]|jgi:3-deoxy-manno-octulosonate cytidylyltransferase (CMP-KDO synthetase)